MCTKSRHRTGEDENLEPSGTVENINLVQP